jgi:hypothetical protein
MKEQQIPKLIAFRPTPDDFEILNSLKKKLGLGYSAILRLGLRRLNRDEQTK